MQKTWLFHNTYVMQQHKSFHISGIQKLPCWRCWQATSRDADQGYRGNSWWRKAVEWGSWSGRCCTPTRQKGIGLFNLYTSRSPVRSCVLVSAWRTGTASLALSPESLIQPSGRATTRRTVAAKMPRAASRYRGGPPSSWTNSSRKLGKQTSAASVQDVSPNLSTNLLYSWRSGYSDILLKVKIFVLCYSSSFPSSSSSLI